MKTVTSQQQGLWETQRLYVSTHSGFYQALWQGQKPPLKLQDLPELPLSSKAGLRLSQVQSPPFVDYLAASRATVTRLHRTSGTTGQAMNLAMPGIYAAFNGLIMYVIFSIANPFTGALAIDSNILENMLAMMNSKTL